MIAWAKLRRTTAGASPCANSFSQPSSSPPPPPPPLPSATTTTTRESTDPKIKHSEALIADTEAAWPRPPVDERTAVSRSSVAVGGERIAYTATAGTLTIRADDAKPIASIFYTAYTRDGAVPGRRPVMFFYNGGPGSATIWLHMGSFAPVRVSTANPEYIRPAPYGFGPNPYSLIDKTDLVFLDAPNAGWSRPLGDKVASDFYGVDLDADAFSRAVLRYITKNARWSSPKFLFGESYGTLRTGAMTRMLEEKGLSLNGAVLFSSIMNYGVRQPGFDQLPITMFPSYAATAWYHNRITNRPPDLATFLAEARAFATGPCAAALSKGSNLPPEDAQALARRMSAMIGLSPDVLLRANLRPELQLFQTELLRDRRLAVGRLDSRYTLAVADANAIRPDDDPAATAISGAFVASFMDYATNTLRYETDMPYKVSARDQNFRWDWSHRVPGSQQPQLAPNTAVDLAATMRTNPFLKVLSLNGYYDMATPFFGIEFDVSHMLLPADLNRNIEFKYYPSGHMIYLNPESLAALHADIGRWIEATVATAAAGRAPARPSASGGRVPAQ